MRSYIFASIVLLCIVKSAKVKHIEPINNKPYSDVPKVADAVFADVIKNISRVNHVLQELINNYEQLQKIYKSQENVESVYSDSEIDEIFKQKKAKRTNKENSTEKPNSKRLATQMFWSDHDEDNDTSNDDDEDAKEEKDVIKSVKKNDSVETKLRELPGTRKTTTLQPVAFEESSEESSDTSFYKKNIKKHNIKDENKSEQIKSPSKAKQQAEVIFIDTHKKKLTKAKEIKSKTVTKPDIQFASVPTKPKTRYIKVSQSKNTESELQVQNVPKANKTRKVKKIIYSESFSPKQIWNDIINNTPIQLEAHSEFTMRRVEAANKNKTTVNKRRNKGKAAVLLVTKHKKKADEEELTSEDDDTTKVELKTHVLRHAYGDACMKLVLRKCHKACKKVLRNTCNEVKCKSSVKSVFRSYAKTGCIKQFRGGGTTQPKDNFTILPVMMTREQDDTFSDMTRGGFLSAACLPHAEEQQPLALRNATSVNSGNNFNILRDRFERACKKISSNKCKKACDYAVTGTCQTNTCSKRMKKWFKKNCKKQCKSVYDVGGRTSDSSDDSDDSDSDDDSDDSDDSGSD